MASREARILVLCKTYPSPSGKHVETSCVAGVEEDGRLIRLFPIPFRLIDDDKQFKKWQWVRARIEKARNDRRPESHKVFVDTIVRDGDPLPTSGRWQARREQLKRVPLFEDFAALNAARQAQGVTLGLVRPSSALKLDITAAERPDWTDEEREKLLQKQRQGGLFDDTDARGITQLRKLPFDFHYCYACTEGGQTHEYRHKIVDWEVGALYWNCRRLYRNNWEPPFRTKLEQELPETDLIFLLGNIHRFPNQWLIVSLIYPPKPRHEQGQGFLFDL